MLWKMLTTNLKKMACDNHCDFKWLQHIIRNNFSKNKNLWIIFSLVTGSFPLCVTNSMLDLICLWLNGKCINNGLHTFELQSTLTFYGFFKLVVCFKFNTIKIDSQNVVSQEHGDKLLFCFIVTLKLWAPPFFLSY